MDPEIQYKQMNRSSLLLNFTATTDESVAYEDDLDFPSELLNETERSHGGIVVHVVIAAYACYALILICENYFVPSLHLIVKCLGLRDDIGGATVMAFGSSAPGMFLSIIGTFVTDDDMGLSAIMGACVFNICLIVGICGIIVNQAKPVEWWPLTRDCIFYALSMFILAVAVFDSKVHWYESTVLAGFYVCYIVTLCNDNSVKKFVEHRLGFMLKCCVRPGAAGEAADKANSVAGCDESLGSSRMADNLQVVAPTTIEIGSADDRQKRMSMSAEDRPPPPPPPTTPSSNEATVDANPHATSSTHEDDHWLVSWSLPRGRFYRKIVWVATLPILLLCLCIVDCRREKWRKFYGATFVASIIMIGFLTYIVSWMVTIIGMTYDIPEVILGYTALAIGTSIPDLICSVTVAREGFGTMALANGLGSNILDILISLSLPWFLRCVLMPSSKQFMNLSAVIFFYLITFMVASVAVVYSLFVWYDFHWNRQVGVVSLLIYVAFVVSSIFVTLEF